MKIDGRKICKGIVSFVGSMGVGALVTLGLKQNIFAESKYQKVMVAIGSFVIGDMISSKASEYLEEEVDKVADTVEKLFTGSPVKQIESIKIEEIEVEEEED